MSKKQVLSVINIIEYIALIVATIAVLTFQFVPYLACIFVGMSCYCAGFLIASVRAVLNCIEIFWASKQAQGKGQALVTTKQIEVLNSKKERIHAVLSAIMWIALFVFALVVLILYPRTI